MTRKQSHTASIIVSQLMTDKKHNRNRPADARKEKYDAIREETADGLLVTGFSLGDAAFGVDARLVLEVVKVGEVTPVHGAPPALSASATCAAASSRWWTWPCTWAWAASRSAPRPAC